MIQSALHTYTFYQGRAAYTRTRRLGWLMCSGCLLSTCIALVLSSKLVASYTHTWTPYLKWQDALLALLCYIAILGLEGNVLVMGFLRAVRIGHTQGVFSLIDDTHIAVRDLSSENLASIFWMLTASFCCFLTVLVGLLPIILIGWTLHIPYLVLTIAATALAILLSLAGLVVSTVFASFIGIGWFGAVSFFHKLGSIYTYPVNSHTTIRLDGAILTVIYPDMPESMLDITSLDTHDRQPLISLLHERWVAADQGWTLELGEQAENVARELAASTILVR